MLQGHTFRIMQPWLGSLAILSDLLKGQKNEESKRTVLPKGQSIDIKCGWVMSRSFLFLVHVQCIASSSLQELEVT